MFLNKTSALRQFMLAAAGSASLMEIAPILGALSTGQSLLVVLLLGLAYQVGNGMARKLGGSPQAIGAVAALGLTTWLLAGQALATQLVAIAAMSASLHACRRALGGAEACPKIPVATKRSWRVAGFIVAACLPPGYAVSIVMAVLALGLALLASTPVTAPEKKVLRTGSARSARFLLPERLWALMVIHQTHYFVYAYAILYLVFNVSAGSAVAAAVAFAFGWITYLSAERLWQRFPEPTVFIAGHAFLTASLLGLGLAGENSWGAVLLWVLTGFGGGSVYCLVSISAKSGLSDERVEYAEDVGHVGGVALAIALVMFGGVGVSGLAVTGAALAATAALAMLHLAKRELATFGG